MILNFKTKFPWGELTYFVGKILNWIDNLPIDQKLHSIRTDRSNRWKPGMKIHFATGMRTKNYECFAESKCISTQKIKIEYQNSIFSTGMYTYQNEVKDPIILVYIDGVLLHGKEGSAKIDMLAKNDGFETTHDFFRWFNKDFTGKIIHWTDLKY